MRKHNSKAIYRKIEMPLGRPVVALLDQEHSPDSDNARDQLHFHNLLEIGYCYYGPGAITLEGDRIPHGSNIFTVIPQNVPHMTSVNDKIGGSWEYLMIDIDEFLSIIYKDTPPPAQQIISAVNRRARLCRAEDEKEISGLIREILSIMRNRQELYLEEAKGLILALLVRIARRNMDVPGSERHYSDSRAIIAPALDCINREPDRPFKIRELAKICHISETHFRRVFAEYMQMPPLKYINLIRIRRACYELKRTSDSVSEIAARTGFSTLSTFNRNFRQITGISPQQLRKHPELYDIDHLEFPHH